MKKIVAMLMVLCMLVSVLPVFASNVPKQEFVTTSEKGEIIIPFAEAETDGKYSPSTVVKGYDGGAHVWGTAPVIFRANGVKKGRYEVFDWVMPHSVCAKKLNFEIFHNGETSSASVYQQLDEGEEQAPGWVSLGVYEFSGDGTEYVKMLKTGGSARLSAVKFVPTTKEAADYVPMV